MAQVRDILRRIVPWALEANSSKPMYRANHKGVRGRIGIVGGARDYAGAPYFASISSMRLGADLAYVICSRGSSQAIKNYSPDLIVMPLLDCSDDSEFESELSCLFDRLHSLVVGPGLGRDALMLRRAKQLIEKAKSKSLPLILDADSLILVKEDPSIIRSYPNAILTPNRIELQRILNSLYSPKQFDLREMSKIEVRDLVEKCSKDLNVTILAKGPSDIISSFPPGLQLITDECSGTNRRCGGQGDILSGLAGTYSHWILQANKSLPNNEKIENMMAWAAYLAAITTRYCNELAYKDYRNGMLASHMIEKVHVALDLLLDDTSSCNDVVVARRQDKGLDLIYTGLLNQDEIKRYTRQMIMEEFGPERQLKLKKASAIIVGAGGLGCPVAVYLGAGGIGRIGIVDHDRVESSNLHRQILHSMDKVGMLKTESIKQAVLAINPNVKVDTHSVKLTRENAVDLFEGYDFVIDATDNLLTRYMISDACVIAKKPLISGAALKMDGQLTVYNYDEETPCFRCLFPEPPPPNAVGSCSDNGVLGVIPGVIGIHQALEGLKIAAGLEPAYARKMLLFDGQLGLFRLITLGTRKKNCEACGDNSKLDRNLIDYEKFCGQTNYCKGQQQTSGANNILEANERITAEQYLDVLRKKEPHVLVDVRPLRHSLVSRFAHALTLPVASMLQNQEETQKTLEEALLLKDTNVIYVVCRRGIASQRGTRVIQDLLKERKPSVVVKDIIGGMTAWADHIDPNNYACL